MNMQMTTDKLECTQHFPDDIVSKLKKVKSTKDRAVVLTLSGPLGAGKTALAKCIAQTLGVRDIVTSPTFVLRSDYETKDSVFLKMIHIDAYRIKGEEVKTIGWEEILSLANTLNCC